MSTPILNPQKHRAGDYGSNFVFEKSSRQDRRRSDKYEVNNENTNNPNTAKPRIITTIGSPPKHLYPEQASCHFPALPLLQLTFFSTQLLSPPHDISAIQFTRPSLQS
jgi:hypothetical protein